MRACAGSELEGRLHELRCHGHSQLPRAADGQECGAVLARLPDPVVFLGTRGKRPGGTPTGRLWYRCPRRDCGTWNGFRYLSEVGTTEAGA